MLPNTVLRVLKNLYLQVKKCYRREFVVNSLFSIIYVSGFAPSSVEEEPERTEILRENLWLRLKNSIEDSIRILETDMPEWLDEKCLEPPRVEKRPSRRSS